MAGEQLQPTESAVIAPIPAAESRVGAYRRRLDRSAGWGVPAHVTVLYPFVPPDRLTGDVLARVRAVAARLTPAVAAFRQLGWFDRRVLFLSPEPEDWFRHATAAMLTPSRTARPTAEPSPMSCLT